MSMPAIATLVPHSATMLLLDELREAEPERACARVTITPASLFFEGAGVGSWVGVEYMAQAIAAYAGYDALKRGETVQVGFLLGARRYQAEVPLFALGTVLDIQVERMLQGENGLGAFDCAIVDANSGAVLANATLTVFQPKDVNDFLQRSEV